MAYIIAFYVPETHLESVKNAIFDVGAGKLGDYKNCAWQVKGEGQFCPLDTASPYIGKTNELSREVEYKVEIYCQSDNIDKVVNAMKDAHPYEVPAYHVIDIADY